MSAKQLQTSLVPILLSHLRMHDQIAIGDQCCQIEAGLIIDGRNVGRTVSATGAVQIDVHMGIDAARGQGHEISNRVVYGVVMTGQHVISLSFSPFIFIPFKQVKINASAVHLQFGSSREA